MSGKLDTVRAHIASGDLAAARKTLDSATEDAKKAKNLGDLRALEPLAQELYDRADGRRAKSAAQSTLYAVQQNIAYLERRAGVQPTGNPVGSPAESARPAPAASAVASAAPTAAFCSQCGAALSPNAQFCASCGAPVQAPAPRGTPSPAPARSAPKAAAAKSTSWKKAIGIFVGGIAALIIVIAIATGGKSHPKSTAGATGGSSPVKAKAEIEIILSQSACWEDLAQAYIRCDIRIHNKGNAAGDNPDTNVLLRYSDGSSTIIDNTTDPLNHYAEPGSHKIPANASDDVYLAHSYNEQGHSLLQAAASLNLDAKEYPYISVKSPQG